MSNNTTYKKLNFAGRLLKIAAHPLPPMFIGKAQLTFGSEYTVKSGFGNEILKFVSNYFNFTWILLNHKGYWSKPTKNGSWTKGMVQSLASGYADLGVNVPVRLDAGQSGEVIDITRSYIQARITFVTLKSEPTPLRGVLMMPFEWNVWSMIAITLLILVTCGKVFAVIDRVHSDLDWLLISALLQKAPRLRKHASHSIRILLQFSWLSGMILLAAYSGTTTSSLTTNYRTKDLDTVEELTEFVTSGKYIPIMITTASFMPVVEDYYQDSPTYDILLRSMVKVPYVSDALLLLASEKLVIPGRHYTFIYPYPYLKAWCDVIGSQYFHLADTMESAIYTDQYALAFKANSPLLPHFDRITKIAIEQGFVDKWQHQTYPWYAYRRTHTDDISNILSELYTIDTDIVTYQALGVNHFREHFLLLMTGFALATVALALEIAHLWHCQRKAKKF